MKLLAITDKDIEFAGHGRQRGLKQIVAFERITHLEAYGSYTKFYNEEGQMYLGSKTLLYYEEKLPPNAFMRIHKSFIVNMKYLSDVKPRNDNNTSPAVRLLSGKRIPIARRKISEVIVRFANYQNALPA